MTPEERRIANVVVKWINIAQSDNYNNRKPDFPTSADIDHSSLLQRLLNNEKVHDIPPPRAYSYPWYALLDYGWDNINGSNISPHEGDLYILQSRWTVIYKFDEYAYMASYRPDAPVYMLFRDHYDDEMQDWIWYIYCTEFNEEMMNVQKIKAGAHVRHHMGKKLSIEAIEADRMNRLEAAEKDD